MGQGGFVFDGGTLNTESLWLSNDHLEGTGTINTQGLVSDIDLLFDATHGTQQTFRITDDDRDITINLDLSPTGSLGVGYRGTASMTIKDGVVIIDVGVNRVGMSESGKAILAGDVDFDSVKEKASFITPVPGGVGPMTITMLMKNTVQSAKQFAGLV